MVSIKRNLIVGASLSSAKTDAEESKNTAATAALNGLISLLTNIFLIGFIVESLCCHRYNSMKPAFGNRDKKSAISWKLLF